MHTNGQATQRSRRLLIVDDEEKLCGLLSQYFTLKGYEVQSACRGEEAIALVESFRPDVVILDVLMPGMGGLETLKWLKRLDPSPRVLMLSSADAEDTIKGALELGAAFYVCKPPNLSQLELLINGLWPPASQPD